MKLLFWRRKRPAKEVASATAQAPTGPFRPPRTVNDAALRFARDYLVVAGGHVRIEDTDVLSGVMPDGQAVRYTTTFARAREERGTGLLVEGGPELGSMVSDCTDRARVAALQLSGAADPVQMSRSMLAAPLQGCGRCLCGEQVELCERCPLREGRIVLDGMGDLKAIVEVNRRVARSMELTYVLVASDRYGRRDEWVRITHDLDTGRPLAPLEECHLQSAVSTTTWMTTAQIDSSLRRSEKQVRAMAQALRDFLLLRSSVDYARRMDELQQAYKRRVDDDPEIQRVANSALTGEIGRLNDVFGIFVEVRLESACLIMSEVADVAVRRRSGAELRLAVDRGRDALLAPSCNGCGRGVTRGSVCTQGHVVCVRCRPRADGHLATCPVCRGSLVNAKCAPLGTAGPGRGEQSESGVLTVDQLDAFPPGAWDAFVNWLLEREGWSVDASVAGPVATDRLQVTAHSDARTLQALAVRLSAGMVLGVELVREAATGITTLDLERMVITTSPASRAAHAEAVRLGLRLLDRAALSLWLAVQAESYSSERERARKDADMLAEAATAVRAAMLAQLTDSEGALADATNSQRAVGTTAVAEARARVFAVRQASERTFLAWDTLITEWSRAFDERPSRDEHLRILIETADFDELGERAHHLGGALTAVLHELAQTPGQGELGYGAWRRAVVEELTARCESLRWRILVFDPAKWREFAAAHDTQALERALAADNAAAHAAVRVEKAAAAMQERAGHR